MKIGIIQQHNTADVKQNMLQLVTKTRQLAIKYSSKTPNKAKISSNTAILSAMLSKT